MQTINHIYVVRTSIVYAIVLAVIGIIYGFFISLVGPAQLGPLGVLGQSAIIVIPIVFCIIGFCSAAISIALYNFLADKIGGIEINYGAGELYKLGVLSVTKIAAVYGTILGAIASLIMSKSLVSGIILFVSGGVIGCVAGAVTGIIAVLVYNYIATTSGGYRFAYDGKSINNIEIITYGKVTALNGATTAAVEKIIGAISIIVFIGIILKLLGATATAFFVPLTTFLIGSLAIGISAIVFIIGLIIGFIIDLILGFILGIIIAFLYNIIAASNIGRIEFDLK